MGGSTPISYFNNNNNSNSNNKKYPFTSVSSQQFIDTNERHASIPSTYLTAPSFTNSVNNPYNNNNSLSELPSTSPYKFRRRSSILQAETLKNAFHDLDQPSSSSVSPTIKTTQNQQQPPFSEPKNPFLVDIHDDSIHPLVPEIKDYHHLSPPVNTLQKNNQEPIYFRQPSSVFEKIIIKKEDEVEEHDKMNKKHILFCPSPYLNRLTITKDLHIPLPDRKRNYIDQKEKSESSSLSTSNQQLLPYPFRKREPVHQRLKRKNDLTSTIIINNDVNSNNDNQQLIQSRHGVDHNQIDRLMSISSSNYSSNLDDNEVDQDNDTTKIISWLDTSVHIHSS
ncbi:hypothetical protein BJ944DRAFT_237478 [Cunninghamella echinulata]|nr:hypothetical protein BJ944DRAFT_237478 [Cunninghamella echinulata]